MKKNQLKNIRKNRGQGMTEYIIIVALIAIAAIGVITLFGDNIRKIFGASADALSGEDTVDPGTRQGQGKALDTKKGLNNFGEANASGNY